MAVLLLSGCLYPEAKKLKIKYLTNISFSRCKRQWMNLKGERRTSADSDKRYENTALSKYPIDFKRLAPRYIEEPPISL